MVQGTLVLVDGSSFLFRAFHAMTEMTRSDGKPTGAVFGFLNSMDLIDRTISDAVSVIIFDTPAPTFRSEIDPEYKANREECPIELQEQIPIVKEIIDSFGIPRFEKDGFEADDLIGTIARWWEERGGNVVIATSDKDMLQLVSDKVSILRTHMGKTKIYDADAVIEKYSVPPLAFVDVLALMGDSVDNIPGVPGIGEKTAGSLIAEFGSLENLFDNIDNVKGPKRRDALKENRELVYRSRELAKIRTDVALELSEDVLTRREPDAERLYKHFSELEFRTRAAYWRDHAGVREKPKDYRLVESLEELQKIINGLSSGGCLAFDTETDALNVHTLEMVGFSFAENEGCSFYVPCGHAGETNLDRRAALELMKPLFEDENRPKAAHNLKFDSHVLKRYGITVRNSDDTMIMAQLADPDAATHGLKGLAASILQMPMAKYDEIAGKGKAQQTFDQLDALAVSDYAAADADATLQLHAYYAPRLEERGVKELYEQVELPLVDVLREMECNGVLIDVDILARQSEALSEEMGRLEAEIFEQAGRVFNVNSPSQLAAVLFDEMGIAPPGKKRSTRADILEKLADEGVEICRSIIDYRQRAKLKSTYLDALPNLVSTIDGRVHTSYHQASTNTGRISSTDPNLQNIPVRTEMGKRVRQGFVAPDGRRLISADYSQIELRILGYLAQDPGLIDAFSHGEDIHTRTATEIFGVLPLEVDDAMRSKAKAVNFGLNYGMTAHGLAQRLKISRQEAQQYIDAFFENFPRVRAYLDMIVEEGKANGFIRTIMGRRIPARGLDDQNRLRREAARRAAINAPIQGSAADMLKKAMVCTASWIRDKKPPVKMILTVHDELIFEVDEGCVNSVAGDIRRIMERVIDIGIPTPVDISVGANWAEL